jgi:hypothetical protein
VISSFDAEKSTDLEKYGWRIGPGADNSKQFFRQSRVGVFASSWLRWRQELKRLFVGV